MSRTRSFLAVAVAAGFLAAGLVFTPVSSIFAKDVAVAASAKDDAKKKAAEERAMKKKAAADAKAAKKKAAADAAAAKKKAAADAKAAKKKK